MKKFISLALALVMVCTISIPAFAAEITPVVSDSQFSAWANVPDLDVTEATLSKSSDPLVRSNSDYLATEYGKFQEMSIDELNAYIDNISASVNAADTRSVTQNLILVLKAAWLAAAQAAKLAGYPCAAKAVEHSILGINYTENNGSFAAKIKTTSTFKSFLSATKSSGKTYNRAVREFTKSDNADLFYALHNATVTLNKSGSSYKVNVYDIFDFALDNDYSSLFTTLVNNWAWLCQNANVLNKVTININFTA